ncbi:hypothetical protein R3P38DRAFT_868649 [Favolaschia claudopus]|uniref:Uncharacterized protein n=1 Tax=Favolaschia claudopus TaxID=2862362 RepID=A0AAW0BXF5_9AGAR
MSLPDAASSQHQEGQVESVDQENDTDANVDSNVIASQLDENIQDDSREDSLPPKPRTPPPVTPMSLPNLADLALHSPSSMIVGTPFSDIHSTRFEYPFPEDKPSSSASELRSHTPPQTSPTFSSLSSSPSSSAIVSASQPQLALNAPPALHHFPASFPPPSELPSYSHPKMRTVEPPVPPALVKRRQRFTLGLSLEKLTRKLSLRSGTAPVGPVTPGTPDVDPVYRRVASDEGPSSSLAVPLSISPPLDASGSGRKDGAADDTGRYT